MKRFTVLALLIALPAAPAAAQPVDFDGYVALGDSLTAGFISGSLIAQSQITSYPALIFAQAGGDPQEYQLPLVLSPGLPSILQLRSLSPLTITPADGVGLPVNFNLPRPYDNLAVPGADVDDVLNRVTDDGGLHDLILRRLGTQVEQAVALEPTFVSLWAGNNDALGAAVTGVVIEGVTLTPLDDFEATYRQIVSTLAAAGVPAMVLGTIPNVTAIPFVTTIPPVLLDPSGNPVLVDGQPVPLLGPDGPLTPGRDFVLLSATAELARGRGIPRPFGTGQPLSDGAVLSGAEVDQVVNRVNSFNAVIRDVAGEQGAAVAEIDVVFDELAADGLLLGGIELSTDFVTGGLFSFDGVHGTQLGYAIVANEFIRAINDTYGTAIAPVALAPFVFSDLGLAPGVGTAPANPAQILFTRRAYRSLRTALDLPSKGKLKRLKRRAAASAGSRVESRIGRRLSKAPG